MYNIIKAQFYQIWRENATYYTFLAGIGLVYYSIMMAVYDGGANLAEMTGGDALISGGFSVIALFLIMITTARICGNDMSDKTMNYEIIAGIKRSRIYMGRIVVSVVFSAILYILVAVCPVILFTAINGWGHTMPAAEAVHRIAAGYCVMLRAVGVAAMLTFLCRNAGLGILSGFILFMSESLALIVNDELTLCKPRKLIPFISLAGTNELEYYNMTLDHIDGKDVEVVKDMMSSETAALIVISGLAAGTLFTAVGYLYFRKKDID